MRTWLYSFLIALPALIILALVLAWGIKELPRLQKAEPRRIGMIYRSYAEELQSKPGDYEGPRKKGWRQRGKIEGKGWGYIIEGDTCEVWLSRDKNLFVSKTVPAEYEIDYYLFGGIAAGVLLLFLSVITGLAIYGFLRYWKERDDFLAAVTHDLKTPLSGMKIFIGRDDDEARRQTERMLRLVSNLEVFFKRGGKRKEPEKVSFDLIRAYEEAYKLHRLDYEDLMEGGIKNLSSLKELIVEADELMTIQIIWNLLVNDLKYAAPFGNVEVDFRKEGDMAVMELRDFGPGMTRYQKRRAFDRYYRAKSALESGAGGFGLGLCTALSFARSMGGDLMVSDNAPRGCVFRLELPC